ncbi:hypothetical protein GCM10023224_26970 [Streptomonospora halophila]|uniref:Radical SAM protein n=1 Tax=Streptomonospora halophila TaxID=427369 RepID=A0ABP9GH70_9ACTN
MSAPHTGNPLSSHVRPDLPGRFNELDVLRRQWDSFAATEEGQIVPPFEVLIHPSSGCNLRCDWCIGDHVPWRSGTTNAKRHPRRGRHPYPV